MNDDEKWSSAAFVAMSDSLSPEQIEDAMGLPPSRMHRIGDPVSSRNNSTVHKQHYYSIQSRARATEGMEVHIDEILSILEPRKSVISQLSSEARLCLFCGFSSGNGQGGFSLSPGLLSRLAHLGLEVVLDLYPPNEVDYEDVEDAT